MTLNNSELRNYVGVRMTDFDIRILDDIAASMTKSFGVRVTRSDVVRMAIQKGIACLQLTRAGETVI